MALFQKITPKNWNISPFIGILLGIFGVLFLFKDKIFSTIQNGLWADDFDARLIYWTVNWGYHIIFETGQPFSFWDANSFFPHVNTLAYSDSFLGIQLLFAPLRFLGISPLTSLYISLAGICIIGTTLTYFSLGRLGYFSIPEKILITFTAHFCLSMVSFLIHYQLFGFQIAPAFFLFLFLFLRDLNAKYLLLLAILYSWGVTIAMYLAPMLFTLSIFLSIPFLIFHLQKLGIKKMIKKIGVGNLVIVGMFVLLLFLVQFRPYISIADNFPIQSFEETSKYSADIDSIFTGFSKFSLWYGPVEYPKYGAWEYSYFPGYVLLIIGFSTFIYFLGILINKILRHFLYSKKIPVNQMVDPKKDMKVQEIPTSFILFMVILFFSTIVLSWGPYLKSNLSIHLPFYYLSKLLFGLRDMRAPGRFGMFIPLPLSIFAIILIQRIFQRKAIQNWVVVILTTMIMFESIPKFPVFPFSIDEDQVYQQVAQEIQPNTPLLEFPVSGADNFETIKVALQQLNGSTIHWGRMVVGYGSKSSPEYLALVDLDNQIQKDNSDPDIALKYGKQIEINHFLIHLSRYNPDISQKWVSIIRNSEVQILFETEKDILFRMK
ncbi:MAG: hypothetical protein ACYDH1_07855 [Anaerolineaceae bacterium]